MTIAQSETTKTNSPNDSGFYSGITIEDFRQFKKLELTNLGKINLILGPNNAGKTSILEGIYIHACHGDIGLIFDNLLLSRISQSKNNSSFLEIGEQILSLFNKKPDLPYKFIIASCEFQFNPSQKLSNLDPRNVGYSLADAYQQNSDDSDSKNYLGNWEVIDSGKGQNYDLYYPSKLSAKISTFLNKNKNKDSSSNKKDSSSNKKISLPQNSSVVSKGIFHDILAHREPLASVAIFSHLKRYRLLEKFTQEMKAVFPIKEIDTIPYPDGSFSPIYIINSNNELLPIYNFGDGMRRWFHLLGNLMIYPNSVHLIEEVDATFHPNAQEKFSHLLVEYAEKFNNQLFMTSHNLEFADKFLESLYGEEGSIPEDKDDPVRVITIDKSPDDPEVHTVWNLTGRQAYEGRKLYDLELR